MKCSKCYNALYVNARVASIPTTCLIDTGSTITVLNSRKFYQIPETDRPELRDTSRLKMADGSIVRPLGKAEFIFDIGSKIIKHEMTVADIESQVILGFVFLSKHKCILDLEKEILRVGNKSIKCNSESAEQSLCRIRVAEKVFVPAESEIVIKSFVEGDSFDDCLVIIEPVSPSMSEQGLLVARTIAKSKNGFVPLRLINISEYGEINKICVEKVPNIELPEYMEPTSRVKQLLAKHLNVFAKSKTDLGRTDLITHKINTGNAAPIKQAPRRIPLAKRDAAEKELQRMIECEVIEPSKSPWSANCVLVEKRQESSDFDSHLSRLNQVLDRIGKAGLKIAPKKCQFFQEKVTFLVHVVSKDGISTDPSKIDAVKEWPVPRNVHDVRSFLGTCSYYRRFIRGFADIARPLHKLTEKQARFEWTQECQIAFKTLRDRTGAWTPGCMPVRWMWSVRQKPDRMHRQIQRVHTVLRRGSPVGQSVANGRKMRQRPVVGPTRVEAVVYEELPQIEYWAVPVPEESLTELAIYISRGVLVQPSKEGAHHGWLTGQCL
ncbi:unnamed protein product [Mytilus coruscus]|uniref:Reverse transcriptase/retrotransposon-derived protein RNase H-like domain-containing protein n=1 Tax=Mytilus coruscus TaxID=42192 RepID=A0A6J8A478_MYTCO|nr:unnamed protein product [Mytilus coruscus]